MLRRHAQLRIAAVDLLLDHQEDARTARASASGKRELGGHRDGRLGPNDSRDLLGGRREDLPEYLAHHRARPERRRR